MVSSEGKPMSEPTLRSLFARLNSARLAREENTAQFEHALHFEKPWWSMQIESLDQSLRDELDAIDEVPDLLPLIPRLREGWPYPSEETLQIVRAELAHRARKSLAEIDELPLRELAKLLGGSPKPASARTFPVIRKTISPTALASLPRWARVAFAARSAHRVERLLAEVAPQASQEELEFIARAIQLAEESASTAKTMPGTAEAAPKALALLDQSWTELMNGKVTDSSLSNLFRGFISSAAGFAANAAVTDNTSLAVDAYLMAVRAAYLLSTTTLFESMLRDFHYLEVKSKKENWTDNTPVPPSTIPQPSLKLVGIHIRNLRAIRQLDLPKDGLGWDGITPDLMVLGGINGTGKTTLLEFIATALEVLTQQDEGLGFSKETYKLLSEAEEAWLDFEIQSYEMAPARFKILAGSREFITEHGGDSYWGVTPVQGGGFITDKGNDLRHIRQLVKWVGQSTIPTVVYLPSENRNLIVPGADYKAAGKLTDVRQFVHRWQPPKEWKDSPEAVLYGLRWEDLNAKEEGRFTELNHFNSYAEAFRRFTGDSKSLRFVDGRLVVSITDTGATHELSELSSGERQMLLLTGELLRYWRPGSLILIDEPELHLHTQWQTQLYHALRFWQKERGGQVIIATQSAHLAALAGPGASALLGVEPL
jgi:predicted ATPase